MIDRQLSPHFWLREFLRSREAAIRGIELVPEQPTIDNLTRLCVEILEPLRVAVDAPITILSGWRPQWLNLAVGGAKTSAHMTGRAADIIIAGLTPLQTCQRIQELRLPFDKCIHEFGQWCHVQVAMPGEAPRGQELRALVAQTGETVYLEGFANA